MTARPKILLDPVDFMALHLAALAHEGVGSGSTGYGDEPICAIGLASWLDEPEIGYDGYDHQTDTLAGRLSRAGFTFGASDRAMGVVERNTLHRIDFETFIELLNIDIKEPA